MALQHHVRPYRNVDFPIGGEIIRLPNEIIKSYLPNLWRYQGRRAVSRGCLELEPLVRGRGTNARIALFIILRALKASQTQHGVAKELRMQLNAAGDTYALSAPNPERAMCNIFCNVARLLRPGSALGRHQEMAYAMSDWFTTLAAEYMIGPGTMFRYLQALDVIGADMTAPLHSFLRHMPVSQGKLQELASERLFRPRTLKKFTALLKDHQKKLRSRSPLDLSPEEGVVSGRDLNWKELRQQWESDPDSVMIDLRPTQYRQGHSYDSDDSYSTYSDTDYDDCFYELVLASGFTTAACASTNPDLWRAFKGGSNNFGIVTSFTFCSFPAASIWSGFLYMGPSKAARVLVAFHDDNYAAAPIACYTYIPKFGLDIISVNLVYTKTVEQERKWPEYWGEILVQTAVVLLEDMQGTHVDQRNQRNE